MAITSRNAVPFLRRHGLRFTPRIPEPELNVSTLKINNIPLKREQLNPSLLLDAVGDPPPDRGRIDLWPPPQEVKDHGSPSEISE